MIEGIAFQTNILALNAALVEEAAAAAQSMQDQAERLIASVAVFQLDGINATIQARTGRNALAQKSKPAKMQTSTLSTKKLGNPRGKAGAAAAGLTLPRPAATASSRSNENDWEEF